MFVGFGNVPVGPVVARYTQSNVLSHLVYIRTFVQREVLFAFLTSLQTCKVCKSKVKVRGMHLVPPPVYNMQTVYET